MRVSKIHHLYGKQTGTRPTLCCIKSFSSSFLGFKRQWNEIEPKHIGGQRCASRPGYSFRVHRRLRAWLIMSWWLMFPPDCAGWMWKVARQRRWNVALFNEQWLVDVVLNRSVGNLAEARSSLFDAKIFYLIRARRWAGTAGGEGLCCHLRHSLAMQALK